MAADGPSSEPTGACPARNVTSTLATMSRPNSRLPIPRPSYVAGSAPPRTRREDLLGRNRSLALREHPGLGRTHTRDVANRVYVLEARLQREWVDGNPTVDGESGFRDDLRDRVFGHAEEEVERNLPTVRQLGHLPIGIESYDDQSGLQMMPRSAKAANSVSEAAGEGGMGTPIGITRETVERSRGPGR